MLTPLGWLLFLFLIAVNIIVMYFVIKLAVRSAIVEALKFLDPGTNYWKAAAREAINESDIKQAVKEAIISAQQIEKEPK